MTFIKQIDVNISTTRAENAKVDCFSHEWNCQFSALLSRIILDSVKNSQSLQIADQNLQKAIKKTQEDRARLITHKSYASIALAFAVMGISYYLEQDPNLVSKFADGISPILMSNYFDVGAEQLGNLIGHHQSETQRVKEDKDKAAQNIASLEQNRSKLSAR